MTGVDIRPSFLGDPRAHEHRQFLAGGGDHFFVYTEEEPRSAAERANLAALEVIRLETPWIHGHVLFGFLHRVVPLALLRRADYLTLRFAARRLAHQLYVVARRRT